MLHTSRHRRFVLNHDPTPPTEYRLTQDGTSRSVRWVSILALGILALIVAGCGQQVPNYWPGLSVNGETVYVAQANGQVFAMDAETGDTIWTYPVIEQRSGGLLSGCSPSAPADGPFFAAPAVGQEFVFLGSGGEQARSLFRQGENRSGLRVLNKLGTLQWEYRGTRDRTVASPTLSGDTVYLPSSDNNCYAVDLGTREPRWVFETGNWVWASPLVVDDTVYIASMDHNLYAVDEESGTEKWRFEKPTGSLPAAPVLVDDVLYFGSLNGYVYAIEAENGALTWERQVAGGIWATPWIEDNVLYLGTLEGNIYALDTADGAEVWQRQVDGEIRGSPAYVDGVLYFGSENGRLYAFAADDGTEELSPLGQQLSEAAIYTSPVFDGQHLYVVASDGEVFALDLDRTAILWSANPLTRDQEE
jgi:outer membrane protein assembly factor BamB